MSSSPAVDVRMTAERFEELPDDGTRRELIDGVIHTMVPAAPRHGMVAATLLVLMSAAVRPLGLGRLFAAATGFVLGRDPDTVRAPDVAFIRTERMTDVVPPGFGEVVPDLVAEVVSPSDAASDVVGKALAWLDAGVVLVWVVDPQTRTVTVYRQGGGSVLRGDDALSGEDVIDDLHIPLRELWA